MTDVVINAQNVIKDYSISKGIFKNKEILRAVDGVNLEISRGEVLALVGESGCGKTTLAKIILGLLPPTSGSVHLSGQPLAQIPRLKLGTWELRTRETMDLVGLHGRMYYQYPNQLSGGQRQRVAIARALINRPEVVVCDEPTSALDVSVQSQILNLLNELRRELNLTYIIISHNLAVVEHMASRVAVMYFGKMVEEAETDLLFSQPKHAYTQKLLNSILTPNPRQGIPDVLNVMQS